MNSLDDPAYRLRLARGYLKKAENNARQQQWDDCLADAQQVVENAGKAILSYFRPIPKTHDVLGHLRNLLGQTTVPETIRGKVDASLDAFQDMGIETHIRASYGDETTHTPPWEFISESEASAGLEKARRAIALAEAISGEMTQNKPEEDKKECAPDSDVI